MLRALFVAAVVLIGSPAFAQCTAPPAQAAEVIVTRQGNDALVSWKDGTTDAVCKATRFYLEVSRGGEEVREFPVDPDPSEPTQRLLIPTPFGGKHRFVVRSFNAKGISSGANVYLQETNVGCYMPPEPVSAISASVAGRAVAIAWAHPGSCTLTGFVLTAAASATGPELYSLPLPNNPAARSVAVSNVPVGTWYIRVYAESYGRLTAPSGWAVVNVQ